MVSNFTGIPVQKKRRTDKQNRIDKMMAVLNRRERVLIGALSSVQLLGMKLFYSEESANLSAQMSGQDVVGVKLPKWRSMDSLSEMVAEDFMMNRNPVKLYRSRTKSMKLAKLPAEVHDRKSVVKIRTKQPDVGLRESLDWKTFIGNSNDLSTLDWDPLTFNSNPDCRPNTPVKKTVSLNWTALLRSVQEDLQSASRRETQQPKTSELHSKAEILQIRRKALETKLQEMEKSVERADQIVSQRQSSSRSLSCPPTYRSSSRRGLEMINQFHLEQPRTCSTSVEKNAGCTEKLIEAVESPAKDKPLRRCGRLRRSLKRVRSKK